MKQLIKYILKIIIGISLFLLISGFVITYFFSEKVEITVINKIQEQITSKLQIGEVAFSLYEKFPSASVKIRNLLAFEKAGFNNDTLFYAKTTYIELSIIDIIFANVDIKRVVVDNGEINIKYDNDDNPNFAIFKKNEKNEKKLTLNELMLIDTQISLIKKGVDINWNTQEVFLKFDREKIMLNAKLFSEKLIVHKRDYIYKKLVKLQTSIKIKKDSILIHQGAIVNIENVKIELSGGIFHGEIIDLKFSLKEQNLTNIISHTPEHLKSIYSSFKADGNVNCRGNIQGLINKVSNPYLNMVFNIKRGSFNLNSSPFILKNINLKAAITNGEKRNFKDTKIEITDFDAETENGSIKGDFIIRNLNNYYLNANINTTWDLAEINHYFKDSPFFNLQGKLKANTTYLGRISFDNKFSNYFLSANHTSKTIFKNASFKYKNFPLEFNFTNTECTFKNNRIEVENSNFTIADSDLNFIGNINDLIPYILKTKEKIEVTGKLKSTYIKFEELLTLKNLSEEKGADTISNWISTDLNTSITNLSYNEFIASNITGQLNYKNKTLTGKNIRLNSLNGNIEGDFKFYESKNKKLILSSLINLKELNIRNTFLTFNNFNQDFITAEHIKGIGTAEIQMEATWKPGFIFEKDKLKVKSHLVIEKGELIQFDPLESLSDYVSLDDLKKVQFSTLENTIEIENKVVTIPTMEIKSSALSVFISGTHTFEQKIDYRIKLLLSELMSTKFRKRNTQIKKNEFGELKENGKIFNTIYFKMTGNSETPNISFDGIRFREDIQKGINQEKKIITNIIKEDILLINDQEKKEKGQDVIIEWDDE